jgi:hypothetical protein
VRIALKPVNGNTASNLAGALNVAGRSFFDTLAQASSGAANVPAFTVAAAKGSSGDTPDHGSEDQTSSQPIAAPENQAVDAQEISTAGNSIRNSATVIAGQQNQDADPSRATLTIERSASSAHSQPQSKASQPAEKQVPNSIPRANGQSVAQQIVVRVPAIMISEGSSGRSMQSEAASTAASAEPPTLPGARWSSANSAAQIGSNGTNTSQSSVPPSASTAYSQPEVSNGRSMQSNGRSTQYEVASPTVSADMPASPAVPWSIANSAAQTGSNDANASQSPAPTSSSPAVPLSEGPNSRSTQYEAFTPRASAELPVFPAVQRSIANSIEQPGTVGVHTSQSPVPPSAPQSEVSFGRSMQYEATSPKASADLPPFPAVQLSNANSAAQTGSDGGVTSQSPVPSSASPAVPQSEASDSRSMQYETAARKASAELPAPPSTQWLNANSAAQTATDGADTSQSPAPPSASPAVSQAEVSNGRPMQNVAASPKTSAELPAFPTLQWLNANYIGQTGSGAAATNQSALPPSPSPAAIDFSKAIAAGLIEQSTFAMGNTFSQSMIPSKGDATVTLNDKTSQFKSSGATFTASTADASSSKASSAQDSISADHSAQNGNPLPQHAVGDSSAATPIAIKPLETAVTQTVPVSNHTASVSSGQPHAALSASDAPAKAQDSADAAAEQLERSGSAAAAGINTARLVQTMSESEMRVGMRSTEFGDISIRTSVSQQQLTAQISVDHSELGSAISAHLPSLQSKLGSDFGLHASIEVNQLGGSATGGNGQPSHQNHKMISQPVPLDSSALQADADPITLPHESLEVSRLDIRA